MGSCVMLVRGVCALLSSDKSFALLFGCEPVSERLEGLVAPTLASSPGELLYGEFKLCLVSGGKTNNYYAPNIILSRSNSSSQSG